MTNCPNCGAPLSGDKCKYCGTQFWNFATIDLNKPSYVKFKKDGKVMIAKVFVNNVSVEMRSDFDEEREYEIDINMGVVSEDGVYWKVMEIEE